MRGILRGVTAAVTLTEQLEPLRADPARSAVLLDVDGTLAPIVRHADDAAVPEATRGLLIEIAKRYGLVACVTGRRAADARRIVSLGSIAYVGNHGGEVLRPGSTRPEGLDPALEEWTGRVHAFVGENDTTELTRLRVRIEDKGAIAAFHWRGARDEDAARSAVDAIAERAGGAGLHAHWGRKVLEVRPPLQLDKGRGIRMLLQSSELAAALYVGDDATDLDAFSALRDLSHDGRIQTVLRVGVRSDEGPAEIVDHADLVVDGPTGVQRLLDALLR
jgi:trehalose 6-phosphate phosphatase